MTLIASGKLSRRLFLLTTLALAPAAAILFYNVAAGRAEREREIHVEALRSGQLTALEMQRVVNGLDNVLTTLAAAPVVQAMEPEQCSKLIARVAHNLPQFSSISVVDRQGIIRCRQNPAGIGMSLIDRPYLQQAFTTGSFTMGDLVKGRVTGADVLPMAAPIRSDGGTVIGAVIGSLDTEWLTKLLQQRSFARDSALTIADRNGVILAREPFPERFIGTVIPDAYQRLVHASQPGSEEVISQDGTRRVIGYYPPAVSGSGLYVSAGLSIDTFRAENDKAALIGVAIVLIGLALAYAVAWLTSRELIGKPVNRLVTTIKSWERDDISSRTCMGEDDGEFGIVGKAIDDFMDELTASRQLRRRSEKQRDILVNELNHRVKNLLTIVRAVARQTFKEGADIAAAMDSFSARLISMGNAHSLLMTNEWQAAELRKVILTAIAPFDDPGASQFAIDGPDIDIRAKSVLALSMAIHEMCTNASKYGALSDPGGRVVITWSIDEVEGQSRFGFQWTEKDGPPVKAPETKGFGSSMIQRVLAAEITGEVQVHYHPAGLECRLTAPLKEVSAETEHADAASI